MKKKIIFRADGNKTTGLGHLYRLFGVVEMLKEHYEFVYLTRSSSTTSVIPKDYTTVLLGSDITSEKEPHWIANRYEPKNHIIIADGYHFTSLYQKEIKELGFQLIYIDDLAKEHMYADIVINHSPYLKVSDFTHESNTEFALGTKFALLRPSFLEAAKKTREIKSINKAFVCFGGADMLNLSLKATQALLQIDQIEEIHVVLGAAYQDQEIYALEKQASSRLHTHSNLSENELADLMTSCNFAIAPTSTILYELCCVKMPILGGYFVDNQELIYKGFLEKHAIFGGGDYTQYTVDSFKNAILGILEVKSYENCLHSQQELFDADIKQRFLNLIEHLC
ncbi:UDP-2,4-diacetamido-2,4,6-trideoxy-beta-L-altropyranose hydrolase [Aquimarina sp. D1M17]|uniref:UDP-2,4-diacetamido-2,4, 6-trideoxy-beta-L-altropyranose hydrolase n=1 Tax=Aquimarina acroporae TaxID=2937283 RepID=UPI0020BDFE32|nr:UDP-2,4-diacetamido-2,4,6-trideoxy-beta-L-altropyranose hydrolase [Aquimarina acroporae]MCK8523329.1 UDP-2,4-diacetamido-2,4,6-trideoxy-beta-L-altropyranose hydrolase [Aquimarina acroporae]